MFNNKLSWKHSTDNGFFVSDDSLAELGFTCALGNAFELGLEIDCLKDYTVNDEGVTGTKLTYNEGSWGATYHKLLTLQASGATGDPELMPCEMMSDNPNLRIACYIQLNEHPTSGESYYSFGVRTYNISTHAFSNDPPDRYRTLNSLFRFYTIATPYNNPPGYVTTAQIRWEEFITGANTPSGYNFPYSDYFEEIKICTNIPLFDSQAHADAYLQDETNATIDGILNYLEPNPEEDYQKARNYKYAWNIYGHNTQSATAYSGFRNYRFYGGNGKICFYRVKPTSNSPYTVKLYNYQSYTIKAAGVHESDDDDYETISSPELLFLSKSIQFESNDYYTVFKFSTDLLVFGSQAQAQMWVDDLIDARAAENFNEVSRAYNELIDPGYGNPDPGNDNGLNGQSYVHGARMWVMSSSQLNHFFDDIFNPANISDILDGTKLFGSNEIGAIQGIAYFPINIDDVATVYATAHPIKIGSYQCPTAEGRYIMNNNKIIDCGSLFIAPVYNDYRDYRIKLYISLPYCGFHCLDPISKYMGKTLSVKYAVDITTGACTAYIYADGIYLGDSFDGFMASQRPLSGLDQTAWLNSVMGCVSSLATRETGMINSATEGIAGAASGKVSGGVGPGGAINLSMGATGDLYKLSQAVKDTPMQTRGGFAGCLGFFGNQKIHIVTAQAKTVKPTLEQPLVGYPSHVSQTVGQFSGYLKCSYFKMADGFNGTLEELKEIVEMMQGGVYL